MNAFRSAALASVLAVTACGDDASIDRNVEKYVTIQQGIYGQITSLDDVGSDNDPKYLPGFGVDVFAVPAGDALADPIASAVSNGRGFYEIDVPAGEYVICSSFRRCVSISVAQGLLRIDYESGVGPGWSQGTSWPPPP